MGVVVLSSQRSRVVDGRIDFPTEQWQGELLAYFRQTVGVIDAKDHRRHILDDGMFDFRQRDAVQIEMKRGIA